MNKEEPILIGMILIVPTKSSFGKLTFFLRNKQQKRFLVNSGRMRKSEDGVIVRRYEIQENEICGDAHHFSI